MSEEKSLEGLGGWLILVGAGIVLSPLKITASIFTLYYEIFSSDVWEALTTPGSEVYNSLWARVIISEIAINIILVIAWLFIAFLFFSKKMKFPKYYIGVLLFTFAFIITDIFLIQTVAPNEPLFGPETIKGLIQISIATLIWGPYMLISKRVKATFIK